MQYTSIASNQKKHPFLNHANRLSRFVFIRNNPSSIFMNELNKGFRNTSRFNMYLDIHDVFDAYNYINYFSSDPTGDDDRNKISYCANAELLLNVFRFTSLDSGTYRKMLTIIEYGLYSINMMIAPEYDEDENLSWFNIVQKSDVHVTKNNDAGRLYSRYYDFHIIMDIEKKQEVIGTLYKKLEIKKKQLEKVFGRNSLAGFTKIANQADGRHPKNLGLSDQGLLYLYDAAFNIGISFYDFTILFPDFADKIDLELLNKKS